MTPATVNQPECLYTFPDTHVAQASIYFCYQLPLCTLNAQRVTHFTSSLPACWLEPWYYSSPFLGDPWSPSCRPPPNPHPLLWMMPVRGKGKRPRRTSSRCVREPLSGSAPDIIMTSSWPRVILRGARVVSMATWPAAVQTSHGRRSEIGCWISFQSHFRTPSGARLT